MRSIFSLISKYSAKSDPPCISIMSVVIFPLPLATSPSNIIVVVALLSSTKYNLFLTVKVPLTSKSVNGVAVPIPTLPFLRTVIAFFFFSPRLDITPVPMPILKTRSEE